MMGDPAACSELILFTMDPAVLAKLEAHDRAAFAAAEGGQEGGGGGGGGSGDLAEAMARKLTEELAAQRPATGERAGSVLKKAAPLVDPAQPSYEEALRDLGASAQLRASSRPRTSAQVPPAHAAAAHLPPQRAGTLGAIDEGGGAAPSPEAGVGDEEGEVAEADLLEARTLTVRLLETWGDRNFFGLTGLNVLVGTPPVALPLAATAATSVPGGLADIGFDGDQRTLDKVLNEDNQTTDEGQMWLAPWDPAQDKYVRLDLGGRERVWGLEVWNYNKSEEDAPRGVKRVAVEADGREVGRFLLRPAPGHALFDFRQAVPLHRRAPPSSPAPELLPLPEEGGRGRYVAPRLRQDYETWALPSGLLLKVVLHNNWGDPYYVGLDGLQLFDHRGRELRVRPAQVAACPAGLGALGAEYAADPRGRPGNLVDGAAPDLPLGGGGGRPAWLAPLARTYHRAGRTGVAPFDVNLVYVLLDRPAALSKVRLWNYGKTPARGAREVSLWLDGRLLYHGSLRRAEGAGGAAAAAAAARGTGGTRCCSRTTRRWCGRSRARRRTAAARSRTCCA
ncbi:unnamed protein product [Heterosigma akashiwo]